VSARTLRYYERALLEGDRKSVLARLAETKQSLELVEGKINHYRERLDQP
jgi:hypothetical protein